VLVELARAAVEKQDWAKAREYLDRLDREFPRAEREVLVPAKHLRQAIKDGEAKTRP
jgi:Tfp pilus assembly protein PilF